MLLEGVRLGRVWQLDLAGKGQRGKEGSGLAGERKVDGEEAVDGSAGARWWKDALVNTAYAPLTVHYSLPSGLIGDEYIAMLGMIAGGLSFKSVWEQTLV